MRSSTVVATGFPSYFLTWEDVINLTHSSESTVRRAIRNKKFPSPVKLFGNKGKVGFRKADIYLWCEGKWTPEGVL
jgi:predicted DNA-binding transcriptional regulator AlpA